MKTILLLAIVSLASTACLSLTTASNPLDRMEMPISSPGARATISQPVSFPVGSNPISVPVLPPAPVICF